MSRLLTLATRRRAFNLVVTNVPGPPFPLWLLGAPLRELYPLVPLFENQTVGVAMFSYHGTMFVGFTFDPARMNRMLERMVGNEDGIRDALTRYSTPLTGAYYVVPAVEALRAFATSAEEALG